MSEYSAKVNILPFDISLEDSAEIEKGLGFAKQHQESIAALPLVLQQAIAELSTSYLDRGKYTHFKKLFKNAVPYIAEAKIQPLENGGYLVEGSTNNHYVTPQADGALACDCDLFNGRGKFAGKEGDCSHLQTATLLTIAEAIPAT